MNIRIFTAPTCSHCHKAKEFLSQQGASYEERDITQDSEARDEMVHRS